MTTPAGWYDDGSANLRWWDGQQWTAHVRAAPQSATEAVAEQAPAVTPEAVGTAAADPEPFAPPYSLPTQAAGATSGYPASAPPYPGVPVAPAAAAPTRKISVLGLIGLIVVVIGVVLACVPSISIVGWVVLGLGFVASLVSLFLRGAKWPGITGLGVAVFGTILALGVSLLSLGIGSTAEADPVPVATPSERPPADDDGAFSDGAQDPSEIEGAEMLPFADLQVGDCIPLVEYDGEDEIFEVPVVPCDLPHTDEVFFIYQLDDGDYPGDDAIYEIAWDGCAAEFEGFVGLSYEESEFDIYNYTPTKASWTRMNDRTVHCIIYSYEDVTGSLQGTAR
ncbi:DUF2510 domain-containing protein [Microbacterium sp. SA39]|uniref:DUF2510 domain-containing protein n=1 Tax=Microbacterium sp. SA39 TaxID=1263625 RepID=UPI00061F22D3|nr:DUF2510 domain-containing protein [Microbacterium sp. SA39]KJQ54600.1 hypothetical protein RS85_01754 [Microbacterium sp. SA39]